MKRLYLSMALLLLVVLAVRALAQPQAFVVDVVLSVDDGQSLHSQAGSFSLRLSENLVRLDLGPIAILGERAGGGASLTVWHLHDPTTVFVDHAENLPALFRRDLPPMWCGVLADWLARSPMAYPLVGRDWPTAPVPDPFADDRVTLQTKAVRYERVFEPDTRAALSEMIQLQRGDTQEQLSIEYRSIDPGDPGTWGVDAESRRPVSSISALRAQPARIGPGQSVASLRLFEPHGLVCDMRRAFESEPSALAERHASVLVLGLFVASPREGRPDDVIPPDDRVKLLNDVRERASALAVERALPFPVFLARPVTIFDVPDFESVQLEQALASAAELVTDPLLPEIEASIPRALWSQPPRETIDLFSPGAQNAIIVIDPARRLVVAIRLDREKNAAVETAARAILGDAVDSPPPGGD